MKKNQITNNFNASAKGVAQSKTAQQEAQIKRQAEPAPAPKLNPPGPGKAIQNQMAMDKAASQKLNAAQKNSKSVKTNPTSTKQEFARASQVNSQKFNAAAKSNTRAR
jgi:hypothetical protein